MFKDQYQYQIVIKGSYGESNFGDDALMYVLFNNLKESVDVSQISFICKNSPYLSTLIPEAKILTKEEQKKVTAKLFIYGGGTQFFSFQSNKSTVRQFMSVIKSILKRLDNKRKFKYTAAIGIGLGPFYDKGTEFITKNIFTTMSYIAVRDNISYKYIQKWNINSANMFTDICYLLYEKNALIAKKTNKIGIIVRDWNHTKDSATYYASITQLFVQLENKGYHPTLVIFSKNSDPFWMSKINEFNNILIWEPKNTTIKEFINQLDSFDLFITARFHGAIFSTLLKKPFISINVEQKLRIISEEYPDSSRDWSYPFDINQCLTFVNELSVLQKKNYDDSFSYNLMEHIEKANHMKKDFLEFVTLILKK